MHLTHINSCKLIKNPTDSPEDINNQFTENEIHVAQQIGEICSLIIKEL